MIFCGIGFKPVMSLSGIDKLEAYPTPINHSLGAMKATFDLFPVLEKRLREQARSQERESLPRLRDSSLEAAREWLEALEQRPGRDRILLCLDEPNASLWEHHGTNWSVVLAISNSRGESSWPRNPH